MISFRSFLAEVARSPERAAKLGSYVAKRQAKYKDEGKDKNIFANGRSIQFPEKSQSKHTPGWGYEDEVTAAAWSQAHKIFGRRKNIVAVSHDRLRAGQHTVDHDDTFLKYKIHDKRPINGVEMPDGTVHVTDGHHRWMRDKLLGKTESMVNLQSHKRVRRTAALMGYPLRLDPPKKPTKKIGGEPIKSK